VKHVLVIVMLLCAMPVCAADLELGIRHLSMWPTGDRTFEFGELEIVSSRGFAATAEVFWTPQISTQLAGTFVNPAAFLRPANIITVLPIEDVDLGTFGIDTYSLTARYHFAPDARFSPFVGAGPALVIFGDLEDRFGDKLEMTFDREIAPLVEGGLRYRILSNVYVDAAVSYMPVEATPNHVRNNTAAVLPDVVKVDPLTISAGAAWRF
jgi:outer membrane protein W